MYKIVKADLDKADFDDSIEEEDDTVEADDDTWEADDEIEADDDVEEDDDIEEDDEIEEDDDTVKVDDNSETADTSMSEAIMKKTAKDERVRMRRGSGNGKNTIFDNWDDEGEDEDGL